VVGFPGPDHQRRIGADGGDHRGHGDIQQLILGAGISGPASQIRYMTTPELRFLAHLQAAYTRSEPDHRQALERIIDDLTQLIADGKTFSSALRSAGRPRDLD
jgi:hypothetical protein